jgi:hypothetical protein
LTTLIMLRASKDREQVGSSSVDYLMYSGFVMMGYFWALQSAQGCNRYFRGRFVVTGAL